METKITSRTDSEVTFTVTLNQSVLIDIKKEVFDHMRGRVKAAGFRPGKAPHAIVERELGSATVQSEVMDHAIQHTYADAVKAEKIQAVSQPRVSLDKFVPYTELKYTVTVELMPKVKLADYKKMRIKRPEIKVDAAEVNRMIEDLRRRGATRLESEKPAKKSDEVNFDFAGTKNGEAVPGATAKGQMLQLGSNQFIPGFEDQIIGLKAGDDKTFDIKFPAEYHEKTLAGQVVTFSIHLNSVTDLVLPEVDDEFAAASGPFKTVAELKADIRDKITGDKAESASREYEQSVIDKVLKDSDYKAPSALVDQQLERMRGELNQNLASSGLDVAKYLDLSGKTQEALDDEMRPEAEKRVGIAMVLTEVAAAEDLKIGGSDLDEEINRLKQAYADPQTQVELDNPNTREEIYNHLMASKVIAKLVSYAETK